MMSSKSFHEKVRLLKYARRAQDLTEEQFLGLLCAVGEYGYRASEPLAVLRRHAPKDDISITRAMVGLELIAEFVAGHPCTDEEQAQRIRMAVADAQSPKAEEPGAPTE